MNENLYNDFGSWIRRLFPYRVQKIGVDAGFTCPNRDGTISSGGCIYCDNRTFSPAYCNNKLSVSQQLERGKQFFARKYPEMKYLAYFQAFTNTYGSIEHIKSLYEEALQVKDVVGIVIGTRPDCISDELLDYLEGLNRQTFLIVEYGIESANDNTLRRINRGHDFNCSRRAHPFHVFSVDEYIDLVISYISLLRKDMVLERFVSQSPEELLIAPKWGIKNYEFTNLLRKRLSEYQKLL